MREAAAACRRRMPLKRKPGRRRRRASRPRRCVRSPGAGRVRAGCENWWRSAAKRNGSGQSGNGEALPSWIGASRRARSTAWRGDAVAGASMSGCRTDARQPRRHGRTSLFAEAVRMALAPPDGTRAEAAKRPVTTAACERARAEGRHLRDVLACRSPLAGWQLRSRGAGPALSRGRSATLSAGALIDRVGRAQRGGETDGCRSPTRRPADPPSVRRGRGRARPPRALELAGDRTPTAWDPRVLELSRRFRVLRYGSRGPRADGSHARAVLGRAQLAGDVAGLLDALGTARAPSADCRSAGGWASGWALHAGGRFDRIVLCNTGARIGARSRPGTSASRRCARSGLAPIRGPADGVSVWSGGLPRAVAGRGGALPGDGQSHADGGLRGRTARPSAMPTSRRDLHAAIQSAGARHRGAAKMIRPPRRSGARPRRRPSRARALTVELGAAHLSERRRGRAEAFTSAVLRVPGGLDGRATAEPARDAGEAGGPGRGVRRAGDARGDRLRPPSSTS